VNWPDELQALDRVAPSRDLWADALARAASSRPRAGRGLLGLSRMPSWRRRSVVLVAVAFLAAILDDPALDGVAFAVGGGNSPKPPGPVAVWGLVADNVSEVDTEVSGVTRNVPIVNNSFYADYDQLMSTDPIKLIVRFDDGTTRTFHLPNPYAS
jgi:hypothetical protein